MLEPSGYDRLNGESRGSDDLGGGTLSGDCYGCRSCDLGLQRIVVVVKALSSDIIKVSSVAVPEIMIVALTESQSYL